jgi:hypothetical protein
MVAQQHREIHLQTPDRNKRWVLVLLCSMWSARAPAHASPRCQRRMLRWNSKVVAGRTRWPSRSAASWLQARHGAASSGGGRGMPLYSLEYPRFGHKNKYASWFIHTEYVANKPNSDSPLRNEVRKARIRSLASSSACASCGDIQPAFTLHSSTRQRPPW